MNRATVLAALVLALLGVVAALLVRPAFRPDVPPPAFELPESLAVLEVPAPLSSVPGFAALVLAAVFLLMWRRGVGQSPIVALVPAVLVLLHPAMHVAAASAGGRLDLIAFAALLLGAWLTTVERSAGVAAGVLLLFAGVLAAPSGAVFAALAAFVLIERRPTMTRGAVLLVVYGVARALGAPWLGSVYDPFPAPPPLAVALDGRGLVEGIAAAHAPLGSVPFVPAAGPPVIAWGLLAFVLVSLVLPAERRFGGRSIGPLALVGAGLAFLAVSRGGTLPPSAVAPIVCLVGVWVAALGDDVERRAWRRAISRGVAVALIVGTAALAWRGLGLLSDADRFFAAAGEPDAELAERDPRALAALRARLASEPALALFDRVDRRLAAPSRPDRGSVVVDRDLAVACAFAGSPERAADLLERAAGVAAELGDDALTAATTLERLDAHLRESRPDLALEAVDRFGEASNGAVAGEVRCREGLAWFLRAYQPDADGHMPPLDVRDRSLARARAAFDEAVQLAPEAARPRLERGRFQLALGRAIEAVKEFEACAVVRPDLAAPHVELARLYFSLGEDFDGERELARARELAGKRDPDVRLVTAQLRVARQDVLGAVEMAESLKPDVHRLRGGRAALGDLYRLLARAADDQRNLGLAESMAMIALDLARDRDGETTARLARILRQQRRFDEAIERLEDARARGVPVENLDQEIAVAFKNAGYAHLLAGDRREAFDDFLESIRRSDDVETLGAVPKLVRELGDEFEDDIDPMTLTTEARRLFELGVEAFRADEDGRAARLLIASLALLPNNPYAHYQLGVVQRRRGRDDEARAALSEAIRTGEALGSAEVVERARQVLEELGEGP